MPVLADHPVDRAYLRTSAGRVQGQEGRADPFAAARRMALGQGEWTVAYPLAAEAALAFSAVSSILLLPR